MAENRSPGETNVAEEEGRKGPRAVGMYDRPANAGRPSPLLLIGIVAVLALLAFAAYAFLF